MGLEPLDGEGGDCVAFVIGGDDVAAPVEPDEAGGWAVRDVFSDGAHGGLHVRGGDAVVLAGGDDEGGGGDGGEGGAGLGDDRGQLAHQAWGDHLGAERGGAGDGVMHRARAAIAGEVGGSGGEEWSEAGAPADAGREAEVGGEEDKGGEVGSGIGGEEGGEGAAHRLPDDRDAGVADAEGAVGRAGAGQPVGGVRASEGLQVASVAGEERGVDGPAVGVELAGDGADALGRIAEAVEDERGAAVAGRAPVVRVLQPDRIGAADDAVGTEWEAGGDGGFPAGGLMGAPGAPSTEWRAQ